MSEAQVTPQVTEQLKPPTSPVEGVKPESATETKPVEAPDPRIEHMAKRERAMQAKMQEWKKKEQAFEEERTKYLNQIQEANQWRERLKKDPISLLQEEGVTYDQLTQNILNAPTPQELEIRNLQSKLEQLEKANQNTKQSIEESQQKAYEQAINQMNQDVKAFVGSNTETYELIAAQNAYDAVTKYIETLYHMSPEEHEKGGQLMSIEEACADIESYLVEEAYKLAQSKKIMAKLAAIPPKEEPEVPLPQSSFTKAISKGPVVVPRAQPAPTLTHQNTVSLESKLSPQDRRQRAIMAFQNKLSQ